MFKTKHESLQEILSQIGPSRQQIQSNEEHDLVNLQGENSQIMMLGMDGHIVGHDSVIIENQM